MRGKAHDENLFPLIFLSDHPVPRGGLTHERIPPFSSRPASHSSSSLSRISLDVTPLPPPHPSNGGEGKVRDRLPHCFGHLYIFCSRARSPREPQQDSNSWSGQLHVVVSERSKCRASCLRRYRETHRVPTAAPREHEGFGGRFKVKGEQLWDIGPNPRGSSVTPPLGKCSIHTVSTSEKEDVKLTGRYQQQVVFRGWLANEWVAGSVPLTAAASSAHNESGCNLKKKKKRE